MKKTIAALLVTILASAGYIVLDKTAAQKIDTLVSQVSSQQVVLDSYAAGAKDAADLQIGETLPCILPENKTFTAKLEEWIEKEVPATTASDEQIEFGARVAPFEEEATVHDAIEVIGEADLVPHEEVPAEEEPFTRYTYREWIYSQTDVTLDAMSCTRSGTAANGAPEFTILLRGKADPKYAGYEVSVRWGDSFESGPYGSATVAQDGSIYLRAVCTIAHAHPIVLHSVTLRQTLPAAEATTR